MRKDANYFIINKFILNILIYKKPATINNKKTTIHSKKANNNLNLNYCLFQYNTNASSFFINFFKNKNNLTLLLNVFFFKKSIQRKEKKNKIKLEFFQKKLKTRKALYLSKKKTTHAPAHSYIKSL